ncbi:sensor histidine kinase [Mycoplana ramosa]|uniref:histidine kinase n=1 Tax=Mycoplana ramosa TaxID=40837 RepID=A0ABW3YRJ1_MYCRA
MQFLVVGGLLTVAVMAVAGYLITTMVARDTVGATAASTALFMQAITGKHIPHLSGFQSLDSETVQDLESLFAADAFKQRFPFVEIWSPESTVLYSTSRELIGQRFDPPAGLQRALAGEVAAEYTDLQAREHSSRGFRSQFLEVYSPLRAVDGRIVAVAEVHESAEPLRQQLAHLEATTWAVVGGSTLLFVGGLFSIVHRGSRTIERQDAELRQRLAKAQSISEQNSVLKDRARKASVRASDVNERFLKAIGADLHDGPVQLLAFAILQASHLATVNKTNERETCISILVSTLQHATREIRAISKGLLMPELDDLPLKSVVMEAINAHEMRTGTTVEFDLDEIDVKMSPVVTACVYRFMQEGLNNAYRHGTADWHKVEARLANQELAVAVLNPVGPPKKRAVRGDRGLGLVGIRSRVESLGGNVTFCIRPDDAARLEMRLNVGDDVFTLHPDKFE